MPIHSFQTNRVRAHWIRNTHLFDPDDYECSACGQKTEKPYDRCPACGTDMHGQKDSSSWVDEAAFMDFIIGRT